MGIDLMLAFKLPRKLTEDELSKLNARINYFSRADDYIEYVRFGSPWVSVEKGWYAYSIDSSARLWSETYKEFSVITDEWLKAQCVRARYPGAVIYMGGDCYLSEDLPEWPLLEALEYLNRWFRFDYGAKE